MGPAGAVFCVSTVGASFSSSSAASTFAAFHPHTNHFSLYCLHSADIYRLEQLATTCLAVCTRPVPSRPLLISSSNMTATSLNSSGTAPALPADCQTGVLGFFHTLERLKTNKRTGWVNQGIQKPESIADHMYRCAATVVSVSPCTS